jgi:glycine/D-amino acid oxidase-like deaminating enzyme
MEELEIGAQLAKETGVDSRIITPAEAREVVPGLDIPLVGALYSASDGHAEPEKSTRAFAMAAQEQGAKLYTDCAALGIETSNGRVTSVNTDRGRVETPWVVNAAGVWANYLARKLGHRFPVKVIRMTVGLTEPVKTRIDPFVRSPNCGFRQTPEGNVLFSRGFGRPRDYDMGRDMFDDLHIWLPYLIKHHKLVSLNLGWELPRSFHARTPLLSRVGRLAPLRVDIEPKVNRKTLTGGLAALVRAMPALKGVRIERSWAGLIDITPDMIPVFGPVPGLEGYILAAGFSGHGFAMGPMTGRLISEIVIDGKPSISLDAFRLDRFGRGMKISAPRNFVR